MTARSVGCCSVWTTSDKIRNVLVHRVRLSRSELVSEEFLKCFLSSDNDCNSPTGNDLARVLRWGAGYTGGEDPLNLLRDVIDAEEIRLDRWTVVFHPEDKPEDAAPRPSQANSAGKKKKIQQQLQQQQQQQNQHHHPATTISAISQTQGLLLCSRWLLLS